MNLSPFLWRSGEDTGSAKCTFMLQKDLITYSIFGILFFSPVFWYTSQDWRQESILNGYTTEVELDQDYKFLGTVLYDTTPTTVFKITNTGNKPLIIQSVSPFCTYTTAQWNREPIQPGQTTEIKVAFTPNVTGNFIKTIEVSCNTVQQNYYLRILGKVETNSSMPHFVANN